MRYSKYTILLSIILLLNSILLVCTDSSFKKPNSEFFISFQSYIKDFIMRNQSMWEIFVPILAIFMIIVGVKVLIISIRH
ncbi:hypothetical protein K4U78_10855 [Staphylococcus epidermidis]|uniref:hypothetical protein n=1 Tax=Staphylococcus TaxID=1279 RepID=UPI00026BF527|nr:MULTISPECIES: hypothetical protein [Staphylococcus]EJE17500.1 hypothetical protein HMPREF9980_00587 [Staphylococcus epidermidis NIHLM031]KAB2190045.1 hypothetical protein F9B24_11560 [Staphylococcus epidermidis]KAB2281270.1 hypothetical protein F9B70_10570 [Staphylococcus epidermidis]MCG2209416.1 hypothetical protein [Staphylococcus epidermidis]MCG2416884.1 hypothetical protein [Staphylococcus epidermidis]